MKQTALAEVHTQLGAKMIEFAGYLMPVRYGSQVEEHHAVRNNVGLFDVSHMGEFYVEGPEAEALVQKLTTNDVTKLVDGQAQYSSLPNENGTLLDDLLVYRFHKEKYLLVVNASNIEKDWKWVNDHNSFDATLTNRSEETALIAVQGPKANELLKKLTDFEIESIKFYHFAPATVAGIEEVIISGTGYTGSGGFELYAPAQQSEKLWGALLEEGKELGVKPCGLGARETLRLEMGFCLYGNDIDETTTPLEAGLGWITKLDTDFIGSQALKKQKEEGVQKKLVGFTLAERRAIPRNGFTLFNDNGKEIGKVTSGTFAPSLEQPIGMGYVEKEYSTSGSSIYIELRGKRFEATVQRPPFYKPEA